MKQIYKKLLAAALGVSMLLSMVGCGQNDTSDQTQTGGENEAKVLTIVTAKELDSLTTLTMNKENNIACGLVYETLVAYEDGEIVPELAEEWGWDETNTVLTFKLRQDVAFTDGAAFNAESVKEILDFDRSNPNFSGIKGIYNIESVEVVDEYTVAVHYAAPCAFSTGADSEPLYSNLYSDLSTVFGLENGAGCIDYPADWYVVL